MAQWFTISDSDREARDDEPSVHLVKAMAAGNVDALHELYRQHSRELFAFIIGRLKDRPLAEEVLQDVMLAAWQGAKRFRGDASARTWLFAIAHRRASSAIRKLPPKTASDQLADASPSQLPGPPEWTEEREQADAVMSAVRTLPEHQRLVIELIYLHGLTGPEAARVLRLPVGTVKSRQNRALKQLKPLLEEAADDC